MKVHHVGYLLNDMNESIKDFMNLGYVIERPVCFDPIRLIDVCFVKKWRTFC